jgi:hypothetical protein
MPGHAKPFHMPINLITEYSVHLQAFSAIDGQKDGMPTARPAESSGGFLNLGVPFGYFGIILSVTARF